MKKVVFDDQNSFWLHNSLKETGKEDLKQAVALEQAKVYLKRGEKPPRGAVVKRGKKGAYYYDTEDRMRDVHEQIAHPSRFEKHKKKVLHEVESDEKDLPSPPKEVEAPPLWDDVADLQAEVHKVMPVREAKFQAKEDFEKAKKFCAANQCDVQKLYTHYQENAERYEPFTAWASFSQNPDTAPIWAYAMKTFHNENVHEGPASREARAEDIIKVGAIAKKTQELARIGNPTFDPKTDTILLFRGVGGAQARDFLAGLATKKPVLADHHAIESWSASPEYAGRFGTLLIASRVPVSSLVGSFQTVELHSAGESEYVVGTPFGKAIYYPQNIFPHKGKGRIKKMRDEQNKLWQKHYGLKDFVASKKKADYSTDTEEVVLNEKGRLKVSVAFDETADMEMLSMWKETGNDPSDEQQLGMFVDLYMTSPKLGELSTEEKKSLKNLLIGYLKHHLRG